MGLGERLNGIQEVSGSIHLTPSIEGIEAAAVLCGGGSFYHISGWHFILLPSQIQPEAELLKINIEVDVPVIPVHVDSL